MYPSPQHEESLNECLKIIAEFGNVRQEPDFNAERSKNGSPKSDELQYIPDQIERNNLNNALDNNKGSKAQNSTQQSENQMILNVLNKMCVELKEERLACQQLENALPCN